MHFCVQITFFFNALICSFFGISSKTRIAKKFKVSLVSQSTERRITARTLVHNWKVSLLTNQKERRKKACRRIQKGAIEPDFQYSIFAFYKSTCKKRNVPTQSIWGHLRHPKMVKCCSIRWHCEFCFVEWNRLMAIPFCSAEGLHLGVMCNTIDLLSKPTLCKTKGGIANTSMIW